MIGCGDERPIRKTLCQLPKGHTGSHQAVIYWESDLCNSQEQKSRLDTAVEKPTCKDTECSVSCEHKTTGEDKCSSFDLNNQSSTSSPVQNPKKCTCEFPIHTGNFCGRCGGKL